MSFPDITRHYTNEQYHLAAQDHIQTIQKLVQQYAADVASHAAELMDLIDPKVNSISYLALVFTLLERDESPKTNDNILRNIIRFLQQFDARQIRYCGTTLGNLFERVGGLFPPSIAVELLASALLRLDPTGTMLTSHHLRLVDLAFDNDEIEKALPVIEKDIVFFPGVKNPASGRYPCDMELSPPEYITPESGLTGKLRVSMVLEYDLTVAKCFIQLRSWQQAFDALERVITYPIKDQACSKIMTEAHNKWLLVGLLLYGKTPTLPPTTSSSAQKAYAVIGKPYASIAHAFEHKSAEALKKECEALGPQFFAEEKNKGLVKTILEHYQRWRILKLRDIYTKISLEQIRTLTQSAETGAECESEEQILSLLEDMIQNGMLNGRVEPAQDGKPAHLVFVTEKEQLSEREFAVQMAQAAQRIRDLAPLVKATNERLATSREYVRSLTRERKNVQGSFHDTMTGFDTQVEDEDLMTGIVAGM